MLIICIVDQILEYEEKTVLPLSTLICHPVPTLPENMPVAMLRFQSVNISRSEAQVLLRTICPPWTHRPNPLGVQKTDTAPDFPASRCSGLPARQLSAPGMEQWPSLWISCICGHLSNE